MKKLLLNCAFICMILICSCKKDAPESGEIFGNWLLLEQYNDPGDGSGKYEKVKDRKTVTFSTTGEITGEVFESPTQFKILDSTKMEIISKTRTDIYHYKVTDKYLQLNPPCIEGCGLRFLRQ
jgi:hypothetical protein